MALDVEAVAPVSSQPGRADLRADQEQVVERPRPLGHVDQVPEPAPALVFGALPRRPHQPLQHGDARAHQPLPAQPVAGQLEEERGPVVLQGALDQPGLQLLEVLVAGGPEAEGNHRLLQVVGARLLPLRVLVDRAHRDLELAGQRDQRRVRRPAQVVRDEAQMAQRAELEREAEAVGRPPALVDQRPVLGGQGEVGGQVQLADLVGEAVQPLALGGREKAGGQRLSAGAGRGRGPRSARRPRPGWAGGSAVGSAGSCAGSWP